MSAQANDSWLDTPLKKWLPFTFETLLVVVLLLLAVVTRFYDLGARAISHDEVNHVVPAYGLYEGGQYFYDPLSHGPLQFHMMAFAYFLFGDNDFTSRIPAALFSVVIIGAATFLFRRYFGRIGSLVVGLLLLISPYMLFYGRYARNEVYIVLWGLLTLYAILRYLEQGKAWTLFLFTAVNAFHFVDKSTSYIFAAEALLFLFLYFIDRVTRKEWPKPSLRRAFLGLVILTLLLLAGAAAAHYFGQPDDLLFTPDPRLQTVTYALAGGALLTMILGAVTLVLGLGWDGIRAERSFDLLMLLGTLILPLLAATVPMVLEKLPQDTLTRLPFWLQPWNPRDYTFAWPGWSLGALFAIPLVRTFVVIFVLAGLAIWLGVWWNRRQWFQHAVLFYVPFLVFYTTFFTNPRGIWGGATGALGYWMEQQAVQRGGQPWFYYAFLQIPLYEFLPALGVLVAIVIAFVRRLWQSQPGAPFQPGRGSENPVPIVALCVFWSFASLAAFTIAGEKMPWLTIHIALPMILTTAWAIGWLAERVPWGRPGEWRLTSVFRLAALALFACLAILTARAAYRAAYLFYDYPYEYLVYAHAAPDPKTVYLEIEELSQRITGGTDLVVAYDNNVRYSYWWYMRHYPNRIDYNNEPSRDLQRALAIVASTSTAGQLYPVVRENYYSFNYSRLWWPNLDYWNLKWDYIQNEYRSEVGFDAPAMNVFDYARISWRHLEPFFSDPVTRSAIWQIWFNRDYREWGALRGSNAYTLTDWGVAEDMVLYLRKDLNAQIWNYGAAASEPLLSFTDPYAELGVPITPDLVLDGAGTDAGPFSWPRGVAVAPGGSLYVADSRNHRVLHFAATGELLHVWGTFAIAEGRDAPGGFNEPWGVAVSPDGRWVYVADTWNHRIQQFSADGDFILAWGTLEQGNSPYGLYGPRGIAVDSQGRVYVADTGNKRVVVYSAEGAYLNQFGSPGFGPGQLDEPVAVALDAVGYVYVSDTWNQRVQVFAPDASGLNFFYLNEWWVEGWYGQSLENKPFITVDPGGYVYVTDPEACRVIQFTPLGQAVRVWGSCADGGLLLPSGLAPDGLGGMWVVDAGSGRLLHFPVSGP
ncbi:MAG: glycosyltransferase family 39 protein [Anaerolineales bacterium]|nr:glycosyltransferase family 39 protein [Anaerolineales bacterium]